MPKAAVLVATASGALLLASSAMAQNTPAPLSFNAQTFRPASGPGNAFTVEGTLMPRRLFPFGAVLFDYANQPLRAVLNTGDTYAYTVPAMLTAHLMPGFGITSWAAVSLDLPVVLYQGFDTRTPTTDVPNTPTVAGVGDLRLIAKLRILNNENGGLGLGFVPQFVFPTGDATQFRGDNTVGIEPRVALDYRVKGGRFQGAFVALNVSYYARTYNREVDFGLVRVSDQVRYGLGVGLPLPKNLTLVGELNGAVGTEKLDGGPLFAPLEGLIGGRWSHSSGVGVTVGGGGAFASAVGIPNFRFFAGVTFSRPSKPVVHRATGEEVEPPPGNPPAGDADGDGVPDSADKCPGQAGPAANNGCPSGPSTGTGGTGTGPGISGDRDKDGVPDSQDKCPTQPGPAENGGCPDPDTDGDGVVDRLDKCPQQSGTKENNGCPAAEAGGGSLASRIRFLPGEAMLEPASMPVLLQLGKSIKTNKAVTKVIIEVAGDGNKRKAKKLAKKRAKYLTATLMAAGAPKKKLQVKALSEPGGNQLSDVQVIRGKVKGGKGRGAEAPDGPAPTGSAKPSTGSEDEGGGRRHHHGKHKKKAKEEKARKSSKEKQ